MTTTTTHPLVSWLSDLLHTRARSSVPAKQLRARAELLLLSRHEAADDGTWCRFCSEPFPCLEWRVTASGWSFAPGFDHDAWQLPASLVDLLDVDATAGEAS